QIMVTLKSFGCNGNGMALSGTSNPNYSLGHPQTRAKRFRSDSNRSDLRAVWALLMDYFNRKDHYGIVILLFRDQNKNILFVETGWPGCSHDQQLMSNTILANRCGKKNCLSR
ncbi:uncharacterized protein VP01_6775g1, partial [Puccinia sorghi]